MVALTGSQTWPASRPPIGGQGLDPRLAGAAFVGCRHCGVAVAAGGQYCCYGCELAARLAAEGARNEAQTKAALTFSLLLSMIVMMLSLFLYAEDVYGGGADAGLGWLRQ